MTVASPVRHPLWTALRSRQEPATALELATAIGTTKGSIAWSLTLWTRAGFLIASKPSEAGAAKKSKPRKNFIMANEARVHPTPPSLNAANQITRPRAGRSAMWRAMRVLKRFDLVELRIVAEVSEASAKVYVSALLKAGLLRRASRGDAAASRRSIYAIVGNPGPLPPMIQQKRDDGRTTAFVTDPNTGRTFEISSQRAVPPLF